MEIAIEVKGLRKSFKDTEVLKGVDFEVKRGEIFALLGSNGAGKTTIVRILTTLLKQDSTRLCRKPAGDVYRRDHPCTIVKSTGRQ